MLEGTVRPQPSGASHGASRTPWKFLPLWCSILCCASLALRCHCSVPLFQHSPQIHKKEESRLFLPRFRKHRFLYQVHNLSGIAQRILAVGSGPQLGCLSWTWRLWELISCSLQGNLSSQDQKSQPKSYQCQEYYDLLLFCVLFC